MKWTREEELITQIKAMIGHLEDKLERVERGGMEASSVCYMARKMEDAWEVLCRRR